MQMLMRGVILGVDGQGQSLDGAQVERTDLFHMKLLGYYLLRFDLDTLLLLLQTAQVQLIGPVDHVHDGHDQERVLPAHIAVAEVHGAHQSSAGQVVWKPPEVCFLPDVAHGRFSCQRDHDGEVARYWSESTYSQPPAATGACCL